MGGGWRGGIYDASVKMQRNRWSVYFAKEKKTKTTKRGHVLEEWETRTMLPWPKEREGTASESLTEGHRQKRKSRMHASVTRHKKEKKGRD